MIVDASQNPVDPQRMRLTQGQDLKGVQDLA